MANAPDGDNDGDDSDDETDQQMGDEVSSERDHTNPASMRS